MQLKNRNYFNILAIIITLASCKIPKVAMLPNEPALPKAFETTAGEQADSIQYVMYRHFFSDTCLQRLISDVLIHNPDIRMAEQRLKISGAYLKMSKGALLPSVNGLARASATRFGKYTMEGVGNFDTNLSDNIEEDQKVNENPVPDFWLGLNLSWEIDLWGKLKNRKAAARNRFWATNAGRQWLATILTARTTGLYYSLLVANKEQKILEDNIKLQQKALDIVRVQLEFGNASKLAVIQFENQERNTKAALKENELERKLFVNQLNSLAGRYSGPIACSNRLPQEAFDKQITLGVPLNILPNRPDIKEALLLLAATRADAKAARASFFPALNISAYSALNAFSGNLLFSGSSVGYQLLGGLTAPIFQRHEIRSRFNIANAQQEEAFYEYQKRSFNAYREVKGQLQSLKTKQELLKLKNEQVVSLTEGVDVANELYLNGYANYLEIIAAQKNKLNAELELLNTQAEIVKAMIGLYRAAGGG